MSRVVLFDFDGVLVRGDCTGRMIRGLLTRTAMHKALAYAITPIALPLLKTRSTMRFGAKLYFRAALAGDRDGRAVDAEIARAAECSSAHWVEDAWTRLAEHRAAGDRVIVVTGAAEPLARALIAARGLEDVELVASVLERGARGWVVRRHCYGAEKVRMLAERGVAAPWAIAYSDSDADLPMLRGAERAILVSPSLRARTLVERALPCVEVLDWR